MKKLLLIVSVLSLTGCASDCVKTYTSYLQRPVCSETVTTDCRKTSVVKSMSASEKAFYDSSMAYKTAYKANTMTSEIATSYVTNKDTFCNLVNAIGE